jgi:hypothetical protein
MADAGTASGWAAPSPEPELGAGTPAARAAIGPASGRVERRIGALPLRPMSAAEVLDGAVAVARRSPRATLTLATCVALVFQGAQIGVGQLELGRVSEGGANAGAFVGQVLSLLIGSVIGPVFLSGLLAAVVGEATLGRPTSVGSAWRVVRPRLGALLATSGLLILVELLIVGPIVLLAFVAAPLAVFAIGVLVFVSVSLSLCAPIAVLEKAGPVQSLRRSWQLVRRSWWRCFGVLTLVELVAGIVSFGILVPFLLVNARSFTAFATGGATSTQTALVAVGSIVAAVVTAPFRGSVVAVLYIDRRIRAEALDVTLSAQVRAEGAL